MSLMNSIVTDYMNSCLICSKPTTDCHHLCLGVQTDDYLMKMD